MRRYETIVIIDPDLSEDDRTSLFTRIKDIIPQQQGTLIEEDLWGPRKLAYAIKKKPRGFYARYDYCGMGPLVDELERTLRIDDRSLKYLTVLLEDDADVEKIQADMAAAKAASEPAPVAAPAATAPVEAAAPAAAEAPAEAPAETPAEAPAEATAAPSEGNDATTETPVADTATEETSEKE